MSKRKAGADPDHELSVDWLQARAAIAKAQKLHDQSGRPRILLICGAARNDTTCPGEMSKSFRMTRLAKTIFDQHRAHVNLLDLRLLTSAYGKVIYPCKAVSPRPRGVRHHDHHARAWRFRWRSTGMLRCTNKCVMPRAH